MSCSGSTGDITELISKLSEIERAIEASVSDQVDVVVDPVTSTPLLLRRAQEALIAAKGQLEQEVQERTAELEMTVKALRKEAEERNRAEVALRESEQKACERFAEIEAIYKSAPIGLCILATDTRYLRLNERFAEINGFSIEEHIGRTVREIIPDLADGAEELTRTVVETGEPVLDIEIKGETPALPGVTRYWIESWLPLKDDQGRVTAINVVASEITERKRAEEELRKARDELEQKVQERTAELVKAKEAAEASVEAKAAFMANMSHELRTPMNYVLGMTSLLLEEPITPEQKECVETIREGGNAMMALINNILDFSKAEKEKVVLELQPLSLRALVEESLDLIAPQAKKKNLNLSYTIKYGTPDTVVGDLGRLRQVLVSMLSNAVKFTDNGEVSISISSKDLGENRCQILFAVRDTGIGIPPEKMGEIFQPFSQVEMTICRKRDGLGLGLAISKRLVELMGGEIWANSTPGLGSEFCFNIETEVVSGTPARSESIAKPVESLAEQYPLRILVAEDNPSNQRVLVEMLRRMGYRADCAADGRDVIEALERRSYDLIFMDVKMPEVNGIEATKEIRRRWPIGPKIIAITAYALDGDKEKCLEAGMDDYIAKPVQMGELSEALLRHSLEAR